MVDLSEVVLDFGIDSRCVVPSTGLLKLFSDEKYTDVTFLVDGHSFRAHKIVMASQSDYFDRMLYGSMLEASSSEVKLGDTHPGAFKVLLRYMYSGTVDELDMQTGLELLGLADRYHLLDLKRSLQDVFCGQVNLANVLQLFFYSECYNAGRLYSLCAEFIDSSAKGILHSKAIFNLPKENLKVLISRDTFLVEEIEVFHAVMRWREYNEVDRKEMVDLLQCIRLSEIGYNDLVTFVESSGLYSKRSIYDAIQIQRGETLCKSSPRGKRGLNLFEDGTTFLDDIGNFEIIEVFNKSKDNSTSETTNDSPSDCSPLRPCDFLFKLIYEAHMEPSYISFRFDNRYLINHLVVEGKPVETCRFRDGKKEKPFCYRVEVSRNELDWVQIVDHNKCKCYYTQELYFPKQSVRCIRLVQTRGHEDCTLRFINCSYVENHPPFHCRNGILAPLHSMTPAHMSHVVVEDTDIRCFVTLHQPYSISLLRFKLKGLEGSMGWVEVSVALWNNKRSYQRVAQFKYHDLKYEFHMTFSERPISIIKVMILALCKEEKQYPLETVKASEVTVEDVIISQADIEHEAG